MVATIAQGAVGPSGEVTRCWSKVSQGHSRKEDKRGRNASQLHVGDIAPISPKTRIRPQTLGKKGHDQPGVEYWVP